MASGDPYMTSETRSDILFLATGFLIGTSHKTRLTSDNRLETLGGRTTVDDAMARRARNTVEKYVLSGAFHEQTSDDLPHRGDRGVSRFIYRDLYADPRDVPELAQLFLELDPSLANSPGALAER